AVVECGRAGDGGQLRDPLLDRLSPDRTGRGGGDDIGAERQLCVDPRLLVVRCGKETQVDAESEQESGNEQATVDRRSPAARARKQKAAPAVRATAARPACDPGKKAPAEPQEQQRRSEPEQRRREEHVDGE